jgi:Ca2+-binding EF-hand superfamily protein
MVTSVSSSSSNVSKWADSVFSKLDTKNQGYIEKTDLQSALSAVNGDSDSSSTDIDDAFSALDGDSDGKVTKSELSDAMTKLSDQLNAQFDASRVANGGGQAPSGPPPDSEDEAGGTQALGAMNGGPSGAGGPRGAGGPPPGGGRAEASSSTDETDSTDSTTYVAAADTDGDGTVSETEQSEYDKKLASGEIDKNGNETGSGEGSEKAHGKPPRDGMREFAQALNMLKAYADNSGSSSATSASATSSSVSVEA